MDLFELCTEVNNFFEKVKVSSRYTISDGRITPLNFLIDGQYFRIVGSVFNDGVYKYSATEKIDGLKDETFNGEIWAMAVPPGFLKLSDEITAWLDKYEKAMLSPYTSESFNGFYSYTLPASSGDGQSGKTGKEWQSVFRSKLNKWRKL